MDRIFTLKEMALILARADGRRPTAESFLHGLLRGWSQRGILSGTRTGAGKTSPMVYTFEDLCRARILTIFREFYGSDGDELRHLDHKLLTSAKRLTFPNGNFREFSLAAAVAGLSNSESWFLEYYCLQNRDTGQRGAWVKIIPREFIEDESAEYESDPHYKLLSRTEIDLTEVLGSVATAANAA